MERSSLRVAIVRSIFFVTLSIIPASCSSQTVAVLEKGTLKANTTWRDEVVLKGDIEVPVGVTLTVMPGTVVKFEKIKPSGPEKINLDKTHNFKRAELIVKGRLLAQGSKDKMITFTSASGSPAPDDWGAINFINSGGNIIEYCDISYANTGIHCHGGEVIITNNYIHHNGVGIGLKNVKEFETKSVVPIMYNRLEKNGGGILFGSGPTPTITHNEISENKLFGIFGKDGGAMAVRYNNIAKNGKGVIVFAMGQLQLNENNIAQNEEYNISLLEGQDKDVDARRNWFGVNDEKKIKERLWDKGQEASLGTINYSEYSRSPIAGAGVN